MVKNIPEDVRKKVVEYAEEVAELLIEANAEYDEDVIGGVEAVWKVEDIWDIVGYFEINEKGYPSYRKTLKYFKDFDLDEETEAELFEEISDLIIATVNRCLEEHLKKEIRKFFKNHNCKRFAIVFGIVHVTTPYEYHPEYIVINCSNEPLRDLTRAGIKPHAWGIMSDFDGWGNYGWRIYDKENEEDWDTEIFAEAMMKKDIEIIET